MGVLLTLILVMLAVAFFTLLERKILGYVQLRKGPNKPGALGLLVPFADAVKLFVKENNIPNPSNKALFSGICSLILVTPMLLWLTFPVVSTHSFHALGLVYFLAIASIGVYGTLGSGWGSNSKYALLGALRAVAQTVSYEVSMTLILLGVIVFWTWDVHHEKQSVLALWLPVTFLMFTVSILAEANRSPFDFAEGESELVSGFNTEYSSTLFVMIFLAEYMSIIFMSMICSFLFMMTTFTELAVWATMVGSFYIWARGTLPRFRYDQLMYLAWKSFLPSALALLMLAHLLFNCSQTLKVAPQKLS